MMPGVPDREGWSGLDPGAGGAVEDGRQNAVAAKEDDTGFLFARVFSGGDGARALEHLRALTLDRALGPEASPDALRHLEGQRCLVRHILALVARGRAG
ncbi:hypothetical protein C882_1983 [Caenispirillum salinarum AK4]|uniref:Bbp19-like phage domain-containing protein n=1 Tax=Caenispirillum salinarum AK4 TaxID=1238182 RepID=K9GQQ1_9PROT|nr:hypothetical protein [Caenispirillum salinarum]EKV27054.1 hypothetical protein C882_1983 [Caenispirillum salinarum AK4]